MVRDASRRMLLTMRAVSGKQTAPWFLRRDAGAPNAVGVFRLTRTRARACGHVLGVRDLIPVFSWLVLKGRCRHCGVKLSTFYPLIELAALGGAVWAVLTVPAPLVWPTAALGWVLLALAVIDYRHFILPDVLTLPLIPAGLALAWGLEPGIFGDGLLGSPLLHHALLHHALGAAAGFLGFAGLAWAYRTLRGREGLGLGDAKLLAAAGAWLSWTGLGSVLLWAAPLALVVALAAGVIQGTLSDKLAGRSALPFGPFLALGFWLTWLYGPIRLGGLG
ncbi:vvpD [Symbiodinium microadriaticum]|nr:vvpD [Symbiodinium microadriaticum]